MKWRIYVCIDRYLHLMKDVSSSHEWVVWFWEDSWLDLSGEWMNDEDDGKTISIIFIYGVRRFISFVRLKKTTLLNRVSFFFKPTTYYNCCSKSLLLHYWISVVWVLFQFWSCQNWFWAYKIYSVLFDFSKIELILPLKLILLEARNCNFWF
jgi:hypothetical protein